METASAEFPDAALWLKPLRWATGVGLWLVVTALVLAPQVDLPLRAIAPLVAAAAICRTSLLVTMYRGLRPLAWRWGVTWCVEAALFTGLLAITGGPFNPFIVMYVTYLWLSASTLPPAWATVVGAVSIVGFSWL